MDSDTERDNESDVEVKVDWDDLSSESSASAPDPTPPLANEGEWKTEAEDIFVSGVQEQSDPNHNLSAHGTPIEYFFLMFPLGLIDIMGTETNRYAHQILDGTNTNAASTWFDTAQAEMRAFLAIQFMFGIRHLPHLWCDWSEDPHFNDPWVSSSYLSSVSNN